jgi:hypothetical protein
LFSKPAEETNNTQASPNMTLSSGLFGNAAKANTPTTSNNIFGAGFKASQTQGANEEKKIENTSFFDANQNQPVNEKKENLLTSSTSLFNAAANKTNNSIFENTTNLVSGNLFGNSSNANFNINENKPASSGLFGIESGFNAAACSTELFGQSKNNLENKQENKSSLVEEKKDEAKKEAVNPSSASLFGNLNKTNEPEKQAINANNNLTNLFNRATNSNTSTSVEGKSNLFGVPSKTALSGDSKNSVFGASRFNLSSSGMFGGSKPDETANEKISTQSTNNSTNLFAAQANKVPQTGSNQGLFSSAANKPEEKPEAKKDSQQAKTLFSSGKVFKF